MTFHLILFSVGAISDVSIASSTGSFEPKKASSSVSVAWLNDLTMNDGLFLAKEPF